jgi:hypothetical protein
MARFVSVKIPTAKVIEMIEQKIVEIDNDIATYPARKEQYLIDSQIYAGKIATRLSNILSDNPAILSNSREDDAISFGTNYDGSFFLNIGKLLLADIPKPVEPKKPDDQIWSRASGYKTKREELVKTLALLRMTEQETVTSSTYSSVLDLL